MDRRLNVFCALVICIAVVSIAGDAVGQQKKRRRNKPSEPVKTNDLSRGRAAEMIKAHPEFNSTIDLRVLVGLVWEDGRGDLFIGDLKLLVDQGIVTMKETGNGKYGRYIEHLVELTPKGEIEAKAWEKTTVEERFDSIGLVKSTVTVYHVVIAQKQLIEITGIAVSEGGKNARVEFTWRWAPTAHARLSKRVPSNKLQECEAYFQLYDDGWRIVRPFCLPKFENSHSKLS
jgi:hypothetical protein